MANHRRFEVPNNRSRSWLLLTVALAAWSASAVPVGADDVLEFAQRLQAAMALDATGQLEKAEAEFRALVKLGDQPQFRDVPIVPLSAKTVLIALLSRQGRDVELQPLLARALRESEQLTSTDAGPASKLLHNLASVLDEQGRSREAEALYRRFLEINRTAGQHALAGEAWQFLGLHAGRHGRIAEEEWSLRQAVREYERAGPDAVGAMLNTMSMLSLVQTSLDRPHLGEASARKTIEIAEENQNPLGLTGGLRALASALESQQRWSEAIEAARRSHQVMIEAGWVSSPLQVGLVANEVERIARLEALGGNLEVAGQQYREAAKLADASPYINGTNARLGLADVLLRLERSEEASTLVADLPAALAPYPRGRLGDIQWRLGQREQAIASFREAVAAVEQERSAQQGAVIDRATQLARTHRPYQRLARALIELEQYDEAWRFEQRGRGRLLLSQARLAGLDPLDGLPEEIAAPLSARRTAASTELSKANRRHQFVEWQQLLGKADPMDLKSAEQQRDAARREMAATKRLIEDASLSHRLLTDADQTVSLREVQEWATSTRTVLLQYSISRDAALCWAISPSGVQVEVLEVDTEIAGLLGIPEGPLDRAGLRNALSVSRPETPPEVLARGLGGVARPVPVAPDTTSRIPLRHLLANPAGVDAALPRLNGLWRLLVPAAVRPEILQNDNASLVVVTDGLLAALPFSCLVVDHGAGGEPTYLLDCGPAVSYAPSVSVLWNLRERFRPGTSQERTLLSVANPAYATGVKPDVAVSKVAASGAWDSARRGIVRGGTLMPLPQTQTESNAVCDAFRKSGWQARQLLRTDATERRLRTEVSGKSILHLACHGFMDDRYGGQFAALALTPDSADGANDDGLLEGTELYQLALEDCQLVLLSACQTNVGPQEFTDGVWGLSRGFLVSGARRVIASNWRVDDTATAALITRLASRLAASENLNHVSVANALQEAKTDLREQSRWSNPFYWAGFVLIGDDGAQIPARQP